MPSSLFTTVLDHFVHGTSLAPELTQLYVRKEDRVLCVEYTTVSQPWIIQGLEDIKSGNGDYRISPDKKYGDMGCKDKAPLALWFWPCFGHLSPVK